MYSTLIFVFLVIIQTTHSQSISCEYIYDFQRVYSCHIETFNPNGFNNFTYINGTHLPERTDDDVLIVGRNPSYTTTVPSIICSKFRNVRNYYLHDTGIVRVDVNAFHNCTNLRYLDLERNNITTLPANVFDHLVNLEGLNLSYNKISTVSGEWFNGLENINRLVLIGNEIEEINRNAFSSLKNLTMLYINVNKIKVLHSDSFGYLSNLTNIIANHNKIEAIDERIIDMTGVTSFAMIDNVCANLEAQDTSDSKYMMRFNLRQCLDKYKVLFPETTSTAPITTTPTTTVPSTTITSTTNESTTTRPTLPPGCTDGNIDERVCRLEDRNRDLEEENKELTNVTTAMQEQIDDQSKLIENLEQQSLGFNSAIEELERKILELSHRPCACLYYLPFNSKYYRMYSTLIFVFLVIIQTAHGQSINCEYFYDYTAQRGYTCSIEIINPNGFNNFTYINGTHVPEYTDDDVWLISKRPSYTTNVPSIICSKFRNVRRIYLDNAGIVRIDVNAFHNCTDLRYLDLRENNITTLPANVFDHLVTLEGLNLSFNKISTVSGEWFTGLGNLHFLSLLMNQIEEINRNAFSSLKNLTVLYLNFNKIKVLHSDSFGYLRNLTNIYANNNQIEAIDERIIDMTRVIFFVLNENVCTDIEAYDPSDSKNMMRHQLRECLDKYKVLFPETTSTAPTTTVSTTTVSTTTITSTTNESTTTRPTLPPGCTDGNIDERVCRLEDRNRDLEEENKELTNVTTAMQEQIENLEKHFNSAIEELERKILELSHRPCAC
ncbi:toll-like receptor 13 [Chironomus tepperi]|uniref:toll-like receptor 13 n=1 Tax=Chironomus tepperi TaxID=113505 RepID=UPI00391F22B0